MYDCESNPSPPQSEYVMLEMIKVYNAVLPKTETNESIKLLTPLS